MLCPALLLSIVVAPSSVIVAESKADASQGAQAVTAQALERVAAFEYEFSPHGTGGWSAPNRVHGLRVTADSTGMRIEPREAPAWGVRLWTTSYGPVESIEPLGAAHVSALQNNIQFSRSGVVEWFINQESGLEQGWTLTEPANGDVWIGLGVDGLGFRAAVDGLGGEFIDSDGSVRLRSTGLYAFDAEAKAIPARYEAGPEGLGIRVNTNGATFPITVDPLLTAAAWTYQSNQAGAQLAASVTAAGDLNGDGIGDLAVGAPLFDQGQVNEGAVFIFYGSNAGLGSLAMVADGNQANASFGKSVAGLGDINNDGFGDLAVGAPGWDDGQTDEGAVFVFRGSATGLLTTPQGLQSNISGALLGQSVAFAGDVNHDGFLDLVAGAPLYSNGQTEEGAVFLFKGGSSGITPLTPYGIMEANVAGARLGSSVAAANDLNADGYMDVVAGAPEQGTSAGAAAGAVHVWLGTSQGAGGLPQWSQLGTQAGARLGASVAGAGDVNGDGFPDLVAGAPLHNAGQASEGAAYLYLGGAQGVAGVSNWIGQSNQIAAEFGTAVTTAGDVNGDGYADVVVGAPYWDAPGAADAGCIQLYHGGPTGLSGIANQVLEGPLAGALFGASACAAGDVNNDGFGDVVVGAPSYANGESGEGAAYVYYGLSSKPSSAAQWDGTSGQPTAEYGSSVAFVGDLNGDGFSDHVVSAYNFDLPSGSDSGRVYVYLGGDFANGPLLAGTIDGEAAGDRFGNCVAGAGDVNRDGYSDFLVGARLADAPLLDSGKVYLYFGAANGFNPTPTVVSGDQLGAKLGHWVEGVGDLNGDGYADIAASAFQYDSNSTTGTALPNAGRVYVWFGRPNGIAAAPDWYLDGTESDQGFGSSVAPAGDVNRDGYADLIVASYRPAATLRGRASVYLGSFQGLAATPAWSFELPQNGATVSSASSVGDLNGDGYSDIALGSPNYTVTGAPWANTGAVFVFHGSATGPVAAPSATLSEVQAQPEAPTGDAKQGYGLLATSAGDMNNDGYTDLMVSAYAWNEPEIDEGKVFVYLGSASGVLPGAYWTKQMDQDASLMGISVAGGGDSNGDGFGDVLIGVYRYSFLSQSQGYAVLHCGNGDVRGGPSVAPRMTRLGGGPIAPGGGTPETQFMLRLQQRSQSGTGTSAGRGDVRLAWETALAANSFAGTNLQRGAFVDSASYPSGHEFTATESWAGNGRMKWRARIESRFPLASVSPWLHPPVGAASPCGVRVQCDCNHNSVPDEFEQDVFSPIAGYPGCAAGGDGIPDGCQVLSHFYMGGEHCKDSSYDADADGVPNGCEIMQGAVDQFKAVGNYCSCFPTYYAEWGSDGVPDDQQQLDRNGNGIPDRLDIAADPGLDRWGWSPTTSCGDGLVGVACWGDGLLDAYQDIPFADCDANGMNDYCLMWEPCYGYCGRVRYDCNYNQVLDSCEIASGAARDQYGWVGWPNQDVIHCGPDGVPDSCQYSPAVPDCDLDHLPDQCELQHPTNPVPDCNQDGVPDNCQWNAQTDCDQDQMLDFCEIVGHDCNANGRLDICDVQQGASDVNANLVPDSCELQATPYCFGDLSGTACPCGLVGSAGSGCPNSTPSNTGARLAVEGLPSAQFGNLRLVGTSMTGTSSVLYFQGTAKQSGGSGATFGDGLRCAAGSVLRLGTAFNVNGASTFPAAGSAPIQVAGQIPQGGGVTRYYQAWYRDASPSWCTANRFNLTNGVEVVWLP